MAQDFSHRQITVDTFENQNLSGVQLNHINFISIHFIRHISSPASYSQSLQVTQLAKEECWSMCSVRAALEDIKQSFLS